MKRKRHTPEQLIKKLREADTMLSFGLRPHSSSTLRNN